MGGLGRDGIVERYGGGQGPMGGRGDAARPRRARRRPLERLALLGSIVQKGKFSAGRPMRVSTLKSVDLPTLGRPTMPIWGGGGGWQRRSAAGGRAEAAAPPLPPPPSRPPAPLPPLTLIYLEVGTEAPDDGLFRRRLWLLFGGHRGSLGCERWVWGRVGKSKACRGCGVAATRRHAGAGVRTARGQTPARCQPDSTDTAGRPTAPGDPPQGPPTQ